MCWEGIWEWIICARMKSCARRGHLGGGRSVLGEIICDRSEERIYAGRRRICTKIEIQGAA